MNREIRKDLEILARMAVLCEKEDKNSFNEYCELQKRMVSKYVSLLDALATAGLLEVCIWSPDKDEFISWKVENVIKNGGFQLNTPVTNQTGNSVPKGKLLEEITAGTK